MLEDRWVDIVAEGDDQALRTMVHSPPDGPIAGPLRPEPLVIAASTKSPRRHGTWLLPHELAHHHNVVA